MVKDKCNDTRKNGDGKGFHGESFRPRKIRASAAYGTSMERLSPFGGLLGLIKFLDLLGFEEAFNQVYKGPSLKPKLGHYRMVQLSIDTTAETIYGNQQGGRIGYNPRDRGKKAYPPVLCFIDETREYLLGKLRRGDILDGEESAAFITRIKRSLPGCVKKVLLRADGEFFCWESVSAATEAGFQFIIANKSAQPPFDSKGWFQPRQSSPVQYNSCVYQPIGWKFPCRFVAMRIPKEQGADPGQPIQGELFEEGQYTYRVFCTNLQGKPHKIIAKYDKRADAENLIGEAKREGLDAIPSAKFKNNYAYFQIVMLAYNLWRYLKIMAQQSTHEAGPETLKPLRGIQDNTIRIARLKLLLIAAKLAFHNNRDQVNYSIHDARTPAMLGFLTFLDTARARVRPWVDNPLWRCQFSFNPS